MSDSSRKGRGKLPWASRRLGVPRTLKNIKYTRVRHSKKFSPQRSPARMFPRAPLWLSRRPCCHIYIYICVCVCVCVCVSYTRWLFNIWMKSATNVGCCVQSLDVLRVNMITKLTTNERIDAYNSQTHKQEYTSKADKTSCDKSCNNIKSRRWQQLKYNTKNTNNINRHGHSTVTRGDKINTLNDNKIT